MPRVAQSINNRSSGERMKNNAWQNEEWAQDLGERGGTGAKGKTLE